MNASACHQEVVGVRKFQSAFYAVETEMLRFGPRVAQTASQERAAQLCRDGISESHKIGACRKRRKKELTHFKLYPLIRFLNQPRAFVHGSIPESAANRGLTPSG